MDDVGQAMSDQQKYSDQSGRKHDSMLGAQWADEEAEKAKNKSGTSDDTVKLTVFLSLVYIVTSLFVSRKLFTLFDLKFGHSTAGGVSTLVLCVVLIVIYFWLMTKFKTADSVCGYSCIAAAAMASICGLLPAVP